MPNGLGDPPKPESLSWIFRKPALLIIFTIIRLFLAEILGSNSPSGTCKIPRPEKLFQTFFTGYDSICHTPSVNLHLKNMKPLQRKTRKRSQGHVFALIPQLCASVSLWFNIPCLRLPGLRIRSTDQEHNKNTIAHINVTTSIAP